MCFHSKYLSEDTCSYCLHRSESGPGFQNLTEQDDPYALPRIPEEDFPPVSGGLTAPTRNDRSNPTNS